ncbi:MAG TPA: sialidase family protein [Phycisphaerae bacterium]|nr:sialidase family protein [Phycisphaerae bacterium]
MHAKQKGLAYIRTDIGGAYRRESEDRGEARKWVPLTDWVGMSNANLLGCESVAADPSDANRVYLALGTYVASWSSNGAIARSSDQGRTFQRTEMPFQMGGNNPGRTVGERLAVDPNDGRVLFFGSRTAGLWRSGDYAATWSKVTDFPQVAEHAGILGISFVVFDGASGHPGQPTATIYAGVGTVTGGEGANLFWSRDAGKSWNAVPGAPTGLMPLHAVIAPNGDIYIPYGNPTGPESMEAGALWRLRTKTGDWKNISPAKPGGKDLFGYGGIAVAANDPRIVMTTTFARWSQGDSIFRSVDGGDTWAELPVRDPDASKTVFDGGSAPYAAGITPHWMSTIVIDPFDSNHVTFVTGNGLWSTMEAGNMDSGKRVRWVFDNQGIEETAALELKSPPVGAHLVSAIGDFDGFRHDDLDHSPPQGRHEPSIGTTRGLDFAEQKPLIFVRCGYGGRGFISTDGAMTWNAFAGKPAEANDTGTMAISADGSAIEWTPRRGKPSYSLDQGATWSPCAGLPADLDVISDRVSPRRFYALDARSGTLYRSDDRAAHFVPKQKKLVGGRVFASPAAAGDLWVASEDDGIQWSRDGGETFTRKPAMQSCWTLGFGKAAPGKEYPAIYAVGKIGSTTGLFRSDDLAGSWVRINDDQHQYGWIGQIVIGDPRVYGRVYLATNGRGILYADPAPLEHAHDDPTDVR